MPVNEYKVRIRGVNYFFKTDKDQEFVDKVTKMLNGRISEIEQTAKAPDTQKLAVMSAFSFAAELIELREEKTDACGRIDEIIDKTA